MCQSKTFGYTLMIWGFSACGICGTRYHMHGNWLIPAEDMLGLPGFNCSSAFSEASGLSEAFLTCTNGVGPTKAHSRQLNVLVVPIPGCLSHCNSLALSDALLTKEVQLEYEMAPLMRPCHQQHPQLVHKGKLQLS